MQPVGDGQQPPIQNVWSTGLLECAKDEESCWWSSWCCCLVFSRNVETFGLGSTQTELNRVRLLAAIVFVLIILGLGPIAVLVLIGGLIVHAYYRADVRVRIRDKLGVFGTWMSDLTSQACCPCCSVAQEAREAMGTSLPALDYCSGQPLSEVHAAFASEEDFEAQPQAYSFSALYGRISKASLTLIKAWQVFLAILILVITITRPIHLITLVAIFLQPCLVMYFIYWRPRRQYAQLDFVIKFFTVGFFVSTLQSICLESVLEFLLGLVAAIVIAVLNQGAVDPSYVNGALWQTLELVKGSRAALLTSALHGFQMLTLPPPSSGVDYASVSAAGGLYGAYYVSDTAAAVDDDMSKQLEDQKSLMRRYIVLVFLYCFAMAFVVAAGTEETMKHFAVRCCRMQDGPGGLRRNTPPQAVMVYLLAAALGFATSENMEYVFGVHSRGGALNALVGELTVLALRLLTPVHLICAVIQAANLSKVRTPIWFLSAQHVSPVYMTTTLPTPCFQVVLGIANLHVVNVSCSVC
ncbi:PrsW family intramembrane metalloprotease [archaeon]|nr:MAG: PrsW family intramembrane metalloprotease [archaeon]